MGLDITSYPRVEPTDHRFGKSWCENEDHITAFVYGGFENSLEGLEASRCYVASHRASFHFSAGSYSGYGLWRNDLCESILGVSAKKLWDNTEAYEDCPFFELINFADNEGTIGGFAAAQLAVDFWEYKGEYVNKHADTYNIGKYDQWLEAFELAAPNGMVRFH